MSLEGVGGAQCCAWLGTGNLLIAKGMPGPVISSYALNASNLKSNVVGRRHKRNQDRERRSALSRSASPNDGSDPSPLSLNGSGKTDIPGRVPTMTYSVNPSYYTLSSSDPFGYPHAMATTDDGRRFCVLQDGSVFFWDVEMPDCEFVFDPEMRDRQQMVAQFMPASVSVAPILALGSGSGAVLTLDTRESTSSGHRIIELDRSALPLDNSRVESSLSMSRRQSLTLGQGSATDNPFSYATGGYDHYTQMQGGMESSDHRAARMGAPPLAALGIDSLRTPSGTAVNGRMRGVSGRNSASRSPEAVKDSTSGGGMFGTGEGSRGKCGVSAIGFSPFLPHCIGVGDTQGTVRVYDLRNTTTHVHAYTPHSGRVTAVTFSPSHPSVLSSAAVGTPASAALLRMGPEPGVLWQHHSAPEVHSSLGGSTQSTRLGGGSVNGFGMDGMPLALAFSSSRPLSVYAVDDSGCVAYKGLNMTPVKGSPAALFSPSSPVKARPKHEEPGRRFFSDLMAQPGHSVSSTALMQHVHRQQKRAGRGGRVDERQVVNTLGSLARNGREDGSRAELHALHSAIGLRDFVEATEVVRRTVKAALSGQDYTTAFRFLDIYDQYVGALQRKERPEFNPHVSIPLWLGKLGPACPVGLPQSLVCVPLTPTRLEIKALSHHADIVRELNEELFEPGVEPSRQALADAEHQRAMRVLALEKDCTSMLNMPTRERSVTNDILADLLSLRLDVMGDFAGTVDLSRQIVAPFISTAKDGSHKVMPRVNGLLPVLSRLLVPSIFCHASLPSSIVSRIAAVDGFDAGLALELVECRTSSPSVLGRAGDAEIDACSQRVSGRTDSDAASDGDLFRLVTQDPLSLLSQLDLIGNVSMGLVNEGSPFAVERALPPTSGGDSSEKYILPQGMLLTVIYASVCAGHFSTAIGQIDQHAEAIQRQMLQKGRERERERVDAGQFCRSTDTIIHTASASASGPMQTGSFSALLGLFCSQVVWPRLITHLKSAVSVSEQADAALGDLLLALSSPVLSSAGRPSLPSAGDDIRALLGSMGESVRLDLVDRDAAPAASPSALGRMVSGERMGGREGREGSRKSSLARADRLKALCGRALQRQRSDSDWAKVCPVMRQILAMLESVSEHAGLSMR
ncbi:hypothetical protein KIPB_007907 [Kipferlia bialata]|uniref:Uncharacterized protein n=2 Tax=Kipferlia bialata TaxID=797122 RepID=A0A9K3CZW9_9EUKA|nr:hypothetical protein KIPB_007907 [Kipferlia bialata]|eukprot:g7907.t1